MKAKTAREQFGQWDAGESVWSIEMGGLGPAYEQAIQVLAMEIIRDEIDKGLPTDETWRTWGDATITRLDAPGPDGKPACGGFSGAQVGAAKQIAHKFLKEGPEKALEEIEPERLIQISQTWPRAPKATA